jgi:chemotaxis protein methyltransferase CheR
MSPGQLSDRHFKTLADLIQSHVGIRLPEAKRLMLEGRLHKRVRALELDDVGDYVDHLFSDDHLQTEMIHLIDCVTTNKTDFFREPVHFEFLARRAVPELLKARRNSTAPLKVWSSASSTGMEAYTAAMVLDDLVRGGTRTSFRILGTDISTEVLRIAQRGVYTTEMAAPVPPVMAKRYLMRSRDPARQEVRIVPELRQQVHFMRMNLMDDSYPVDRDVDVIFCRNVLIYFDKETQRKVVQRLCDHLRPGGFLMVGHSEAMVHNGSSRLRQVQPTIYQV